MSGSTMPLIEISSDSDEDASVDGSRVVKVTDARQDKAKFHLDDVIELTDSDSSLELPDQLSPMVQQPKSTRRVSHATRKYTPLYADTSDEDGAIIIMNDPPCTRKPIPISSPTKNVKRRFFTEVADTPAMPSDFSSTASILPRSPSKKHPATPSADKSTSTPSKLSKKAREAKEQARREQYAADLFVQLNGTVFDGRLPKETKLEWNKRLLTTAGRARWHRWALHDTSHPLHANKRMEQLTRWRGHHQD
ncbi:hypothetical protein SCLCIDRAFT_223183 [Scleroderma citrinum Foug A]|uniref:Uncharacterized protein n=1 Tax=Scleroderma citrinum Foug A TaxID=1036808 RepID=A0A0C3A0D7_9AGAM|nr:hypothetical protein SCLCIDRAFT_223183 [Scleroderma citrinum Foug A]